MTKETTQFEFVQLDSSVHFDNWTDSLQMGLQQSNCALFSNYSSKVSRCFLSPYIAEKTKELIIIPNDVLFRVNFEYLPVNTQTVPCQFNDLEYAINKYSFRYVYFPEELLESRPTSPGKVLAVAPGFSDDSQDRGNSSATMGPKMQNSYAALPWSIQTAKKLKSELHADVLLGSKSSEKALKKTIENYAIIHFGTHAEMDDDRPLMSKLVLSTDEEEEDGLLHTHEIYGLSLDAELVSLTACETGLGRIQAGEGMLSLARAFSYAGCPAVAMSLWKIDDQSSAGIMEHFYQDLGKQMPKDVALREAKLDYLKNNGGELKNPLYWAGMVLVGNADPVHIIGNNSWLFYLGIILFSFAMLLAYKLVRRVKMA